MKNNMPTQDIFDLLINPRENDLVVGTYGRGIYITDISPLQEMVTLEGGSEPGLNRVIWDIRRQLTPEERDWMRDSPRMRRRQGELVAPGEYIVILQVGDERLQGVAKVRKMPGN